MTSQIYRLPIGVECSSHGGKICVSGTYGSVTFRSVSTLYRKGNIVTFLPDLKSYDSSIFTQAVQGVVFGYTIELQLKGIGYRVVKEQNKLIFYLGYSLPVYLTIPQAVSARVDKKSIFLMSANLGLLQNFATTIRRYRFPDSYKGSGVVYADEVILCKEGKKN